MHDSRASAKTSALDKELVSLLGLYFFKSLKGFSCDLPHFMMYKFNLAAQDSFRSWHTFIPGNNLIEEKKGEIKKLSSICNSVYQNISAVYNSEISIDNFNRRIEIISVIVGITKARLKKYFNPASMTFNLFDCLYEHLFMPGRFNKTKKEILHSLSGYSENYPSLTFKETVKKVKISEAALYDAIKVFKIESKSLISTFEFIKPYLNYNALFGLTQDFVMISSGKFGSIKTQNPGNAMTNHFISDVLKRIYHYETFHLEHSDTTCLIKPGIVDTEQLIQLLNKLDIAINSSPNILEFILTFLRNYPSR